MFTLQQIKEAHAKVKSGADFPAYIQALNNLGVAHYATYVTDCHTLYTGKEQERLFSASRYTAIAIADNSDPALLKIYLQEHQQGKTDYFTFCNQAAATGVWKWVVDLYAMTCTYYDKAGTVMLAEEIPLLLD
ncbi:MAG TPA: DUF1398 family protein [Ohtaekwangia sp.]|uniref:DUF1398 domain-containing protein n=1 Tax=Ohtaekwangia sp. TaxID=2066019 RepID=UPI002F95C76E